MHDIQQDLMHGVKGLISFVFNHTDKAADVVEWFGKGMKSIISPNQNNGREFATTDEPKKGKMSIEDLLGQGKGTSTIKIDDLEEWDKVAEQYGVDYAIVEKQVYENDNITPKMDYSNCIIEKNPDGTDKMDYTRCKKAKDENGYEKFDDKGLPILEDDSLPPEPVLAEGSPEPVPLKECTVFFKAQDTDVITEAFKDYVHNGFNKDLQKAKEKDALGKSNEKLNIKSMIKEFTEKAKELNKNNPERHHNIGEQSL